MNTVAALLAPNVARHPRRAAYFCEGETLTYSDLDERSGRFGQGLLASGVKAGDRALLVLPDGFPFLYAFLGCLKAGIWPALVSPLLSKDDTGFVLSDSEATALVTAPDLPAAAADSPHLRTRLALDPDSMGRFLSSAPGGIETAPADDDDTAFFLYTSGTTGEPKGVPHAHGDMPFTADSYGVSILALAPADTVFSASKLFFAYGLGNSVSFPLRAGVPAILHPGKATADEVVRLFNSHRPTVFFGVPTLYSLLLRSLDDWTAFGSLRLCVSAGEALPAPLAVEWRSRAGVEVVDGLGTSETLHIVLSNRPGAVRPGSAGIPVPGYELRLVDEEGRDVPRGVPGQLLVRGRSLARSYWKRPEKTSETMLPHGWLRTGDVLIEEAGVYTHQGRADDMFKVDAQWISPVQVESVLYGHAAVKECAVTATKAEGLVKVGAHVVLGPGFTDSIETIASIRRHVLSHLPPHMCPARFTFCAELPKTATGKVQRFRLRGA